mmetsp:Transcript_26289/g.34085  ORF Transcript_26289/g.34085 Transcript_26289/m.34085 type:complete len:220 (+) Transcript_26289:482-1141(+)
MAFSEDSKSNPICLPTSFARLALRWKAPSSVAFSGRGGSPLKELFLNCVESGPDAPEPFLLAIDKLCFFIFLRVISMSESSLLSLCSSRPPLGRRLLSSIADSESSEDSSESVASPTTGIPLARARYERCWAAIPYAPRDIGRALPGLCVGCLVESTPKPSLVNRSSRLFCSLESPQNEDPAVEGRTTPRLSRSLSMMSESRRCLELALLQSSAKRSFG